MVDNAQIVLQSSARLELEICDLRVFFKKSNYILAWQIIVLTWYHSDIGYLGDFSIFIEWLKTAVNYYKAMTWGFMHLWGWHN